MKLYIFRIQWREYIYQKSTQVEMSIVRMLGFTIFEYIVKY